MSETIESPLVHLGVARGRSLFNRAEFWACHEALEAAWQATSSGHRDILQGVIQVAAGFHKVLIQDNPRGALRLLDRGLSKLPAVESDSLGVAWQPFRAAVEGWRARILSDTPLGLPVVGLPKLEWSHRGQASLIRLDWIEAWRVPGPGPGTVLVAVGHGDTVGWGEASLSFERRGVWESLAEALAPGLLNEAVAAPSELPVIWSDVSASPAAKAGLEAAVWDLYARRLDMPLMSILELDGQAPTEAATVDPPAAGHLDAWLDRIRTSVRGIDSDPDSFGERRRRRSRASDGAPAGASTDPPIMDLRVPLRPRGDYRLARLVAPVTEGLPVRLIYDLGGAYRRADFEALKFVAATGPDALWQPFPVHEVVQSARLRRLVDVPVVVGGFVTAELVESAYMGKALDAVWVDPGQAGLYEAVRIADYCEERGLPVWVRSGATTEVGWRHDLAMAHHPAVTGVWRTFGNGAGGDPEADLVAERHFRLEA